MGAIEWVAVAMRSGEYSRVVLGVKGGGVEWSYNPRLISPASQALLASTHCERGEAPRLCTRKPLPPGTGIARARRQPPAPIRIRLPAIARSPGWGRRWRKSRAPSCRIDPPRQSPRALPAFASGLASGCHGPFHCTRYVRHCKAFGGGVGGGNLGPVMLLQLASPLPVKNQARWVVQFLADMTALHVHTGDSYFNIILVDFESEDMDVERALRAAQLPR